MGERFVPYLPRDREDELRRIAKVLVAPGKGILAADESNNSMSKRLDMIKMENNEEHRRQYRQMLLCCGKEMSEHIGGVILFHETVYQKADDGVSFIKHLQQNGVVPGIKVGRSLSALIIGSARVLDIVMCECAVAQFTGPAIGAGTKKWVGQSGHECRRHRGNGSGEGAVPLPELKNSITVVQLPISCILTRF